MRDHWIEIKFPFQCSSVEEIPRKGTKLFFNVLNFNQNANIISEGLWFLPEHMRIFDSLKCIIDTISSSKIPQMLMNCRSTNIFWVFNLWRDQVNGENTRSTRIFYIPKDIKMTKEIRKSPLNVFILTDSEKSEWKRKRNFWINFVCNEQLTFYKLQF